ncbi:MAG: FixH family protein [Betaproteobacteria bacterium]|nr:FixH family protein [Betaproteobacteria bacterium]
MNAHAQQSAGPWYREPWPWLLMAGPAIVVVAGFLTLGFAVQSFDGLVADDYYKQGKAINKTMQRDTRALELGYRATVTLSAAERAVRLSFADRDHVPAATELRLGLHHPTRGGLDRELVLARTADGSYSAALPALEQARWKLVLDDRSREWRLTGEWPMSEAAVTLGAPAAKK